jgi:hypothetical protein
VSTPSRDDARAVLGRFAAPGRVVSLEPHTSGLINHSWLATLASAGGERRFLLQQINRRVFRRPDQVMENMLRVTRHVARQFEAEGVRDASRRVLAPVGTLEAGPAYVDAAGETWRLVPWLEGTRSVARATTTAEAHETARAFGHFLRQLQDLPEPPLHTTIPGFHDTESRFAAFTRVAAEDPVSRLASCRDEVAAVLDRRPLAAALAGPAARGEIMLRPTHNDAKIANVLFDAASGEALAVVDLDTTMPGLALHDFGDLVRSGVSDSEEDERKLDCVRVRVPFFEALARGFLAGAESALSPAERSLLVAGALAIVYEQAIRFLGDYLDGDRYYRTSRPGHNLDRARAQLRLLASLESERPELDAIVATAAAQPEPR